MKTLLSLLFIISCSQSTDLGKNFSFQDPFFLDRNQSLVSCQVPQEKRTFVNKLKTQSFKTLDELSKKYISQRGIKYTLWAKNSEDRLKLCSALESFATANLSGLGQAEKKAFYINAHNFMVIHLVLSFQDQLDRPNDFEITFPERSILYIGNKGDRLWRDFNWTIAGENLSLDELELTRLLPLGDPLTRLALHRSSKTLRYTLFQSIYTAENLETRLKFLASEVTNFESFYDEDEKIVEIPFILKAIENDLVSGKSLFSNLMDFLVFFLDEAEVGIKRDDLKQNYSLIVTGGEEASLDWSLNETR